MIPEDKHNLDQSRWSKRTGRAIDVLCFIALLAVIATVIYGFALRAFWAHGYYVAVVLAIIGAAVMLIGLAQQAIAARDAATWRSMAEWQLRAARQRVTNGVIEPLAEDDHDLDPDSRHYYEHLVEVLLEGMQRGEDKETAA